MTPKLAVGLYSCDHIVAAICHVRILKLVKYALFAKAIKFSGNINLKKTVVGSLGTKTYWHTEFFNFILFIAVSFTHDNWAKLITHPSQDLDHSAITGQVCRSHPNKQ